MRVTDTAAARDGVAPALLQPAEIQYPHRIKLPDYLRDYRALLKHPATRWAAGIYQLHRGHSAEVLPLPTSRK